MKSRLIIKKKKGTFCNVSDSVFIRKNFLDIKYDGLFGVYFLTLNIGQTDFAPQGIGRAFITLSQKNMEELFDWILEERLIREKAKRGKTPKKYNSLRLITEDGDA